MTKIIFYLAIASLVMLNVVISVRSLVTPSCAMPASPAGKCWCYDNAGRPVQCWCR